MDGKEQAIIDIAKTIAWHHRDRKNPRWQSNEGVDNRRINDYYAETEYKTFIPAAHGVLALIESWSGTDEE